MNTVIPSLNLVKHTAAVHIASILTLNQRKIANILLHNSYNSILEDKIHSIKLNKILNTLGWKEGSEITNLIKSDLKSLNKLQLEWNILNKDRKNSWGVTTLLADVRIEKGEIYYTYSKSLREMLFNPNIYAKLDLIIQKNLKNKHALVLWEYLLESLCSSKANKVITENITIENLRKLLGVDENKSYHNYAIFRAQALLPALNEINNKSDITVSIIAKRESRKIVQVCFDVERKIAIQIEKDNTKKIDIPFKKVDNVTQKVIIDPWILKHYTYINLSLNKVERDITKFGEGKVLKAMRITYQDFLNGKAIRSLKSYYSAALKDDWEFIDSNLSNYKALEIVKTSIEKENIINSEQGIDSDLKNLLLENFGIALFKSWFEDLKVEDYQNDTIKFKTSSPFKANWLKNNYKEKMLNLIKKFDERINQIEITYNE